jgi:hypothetical protein
MLSCYEPRIHQLINKNLHDYCRKTTEESIKKITDKYNLERNKPKINNPLPENDDSGKPEFNFYGLLAFLSVSTIAFLIYKRLK